MPKSDATAPGLLETLRSIIRDIEMPPDTDVPPAGRFRLSVSESRLLRDALRLRPVHIAVAMFAQRLDSGQTGFLWLAAIESGPDRNWIKDAEDRGSEQCRVGDLMVYRLGPDNATDLRPEYFCVIDGVAYTCSEVGFLKEAIGWMMSEPLPEDKLDPSQHAARRLRSQSAHDAPFRFVVRSQALWKALARVPEPSPRLRRLREAADMLSIEAFGGNLTAEADSLRFETHLIAREDSPSIWNAMDPIGRPWLIERTPDSICAFLEVRASPDALLSAIAAQSSWLGFDVAGINVGALRCPEVDALIESFTGRVAIGMAQSPTPSSSDAPSACLIFESRDVERTRDTLQRLSGDTVKVLAHEFPSGDLFTLQVPGGVLYCGLMRDGAVVSSRREVALSWTSLRPVSERPLAQAFRLEGALGAASDRDVGRAVLHTGGSLSLWRWFVRFVFEALPRELVGLQNLGKAEELAAGDAKSYAATITRRGSHVTIQLEALRREVPSDPVAHSSWSEKMREGGRLLAVGELAAAAQEFRSAYDIARKRQLGPLELSNAATRFAQIRGPHSLPGERAAVLEDCLNAMEQNAPGAANQRACVANMLLRECADDLRRPGAAAAAESAVHAFDALLGPRNSLTLQARMLWGASLVAEGSYHGGLQALDPGLRCARQCEGLDSMLVAQLVNRLAAARFERGEYEHALDLELETVRWIKSTGGEGDPLEAIVHMNIGRTLARLGRMADAVRELSIAETAFVTGRKGSRREIASCRLAAAEVCVLEGSIPAADRALEAFRGEFGADATGELTEQWAMAEFLTGLVRLGGGEAGDATMHLSRARALSAKVFGERHPRTARIDLELALAHARARRQPTEIQEAVRALDAWASAVGGQHPDVQRAASELRALLSTVENSGELASALNRSETAVGR